MSSTFSPNKGLELMVTGEDDGTWGIKTDSNLSILDLNLGGRLNISVAGNANVTLTATQAQNVLHVLTGVLTGNIQYIFPAKGGLYVIENATTGAFTVTAAMAGGSGSHVIPQGVTMTIFINPDGNTGVAVVASNVAGGTVTSITAGSGITCTPNPITGAGTISAVATGVTYLAAGNGISLSPNPITGTGTISVAGTISTGAFVASSSLQCQAGGGNALLYLQNNARQWYLIDDGSGNLSLADGSAGAYRTSWYTNGNVQIYNALTVGSISTNGITCTTINTQGNQITSGTISCGYLTTNGNGFNCGPIGCGGITCTTINTQGNQINAGTIACGFISSASINTNGNDITCHHPIVTDGVTYSNLGNHCIGFNNSGTTLTFYALGGSSGSWNFTGSDERLKVRIGPVVGNALAEINRLTLISFDMPFEDAPTRHFDCGFSAQDVQRIAPDCVTTVTHPDGKEQLVLDTLPIIARCVGSIQQLTDRVETLEARLAALETKLG